MDFQDFKEMIKWHLTPLNAQKPALDAAKRLNGGVKAEKSEFIFVNA